MHVFLAAVLALSHAQRSEIDAIVGRVMHDRHIPGLSLGVARGDAPIYLRGYGARDVRSRLPADPYTIYRIGSITKQFTAALAMQDVGAGRIALAAPVSRYLASAPSATGRVTVEQLLDQTSGIATDAAGPDEPLVAEPGTLWTYSNVNYQVLDAILERTEGATVPTLLRARIVEPLGLTSTGTGIPAFATNVARGYVWESGWREVAPSADRARLGGPMVSNAPDLLHWLTALRAGRVVPSGAFAAMTVSATLRDATPTNYGFGFFVGDWFGHAVVEHPGYVDGFSAEDALLLDDGLAIAILSNADSVDLTPLAKSVVAILERPRDSNLLAQLSRPPQNEDLQITSDLKAIVLTPGFANLGRLISIEFIERTLAGGVSHDKYRLTFSSGRWWVTIAYRERGPIEALTFSPVE